MPIYAYRCGACGHNRDILQKLSDPVLTTCPACGAEAFAKQVTAAGFQLKGSGWYVTDFRGGNNAGKKGDEKAVEGEVKADAKTDPKADAKVDAKADAKAETKAEGRTQSKADSSAPAPAPPSSPAPPPAAGT